ncbi:MAG: hypothetical protein K2M19_02255 [Muribaculaceae bacterium]|nr:hypothetical protein [Muribaculaceae bacterium]
MKGLRVILFPIMLLSMIVSFTACSGDEDEPMIPCLPEIKSYEWEVFLVDKDGLNLLNTCDDTFSLIDHKLWVEVDGKETCLICHGVFKDGYNEYSKTENCFSYLTEEDAENWINMSIPDIYIYPDTTRHEGRECKFNPGQLDYYWYKIWGDKYYLDNGLKLSWPEGGQSWELRSEPNPDNQELTDFYMNDNRVMTKKWDPDEAAVLTIVVNTL